MDEPWIVDPRVISILMNSIGWEVFSGDGREIVPNSEGIPSIQVTKEETARIGAATRRILEDLRALKGGTLTET